jgi:acyl carrier protein
LKEFFILREDILGLVYAAIDDVNAQSVDGALIGKTPDSPLLAGKKGVDSLTFVNLIVALEEQIQTSTGDSVVLVDESSMALQEHPFRTVGTLAAYVEQVLSRQRN